MKSCSVMAAVLFFGLTMLTGCRTPSLAGFSIETYPKNVLRVNARILAGQLSIADVSMTVKNDLRIGQVIAQNVTQHDCQFEYCFEWLDKDGMTFGVPMTVWTPVSIRAMEKKSMQAIAPNKEAVDFVFIVRFRRAGRR